MSLGNTVVLIGEIRIIGSRIVKADESELLEIEATVQTGFESHGGLHTVILFGETARKANAFIQANGGDGMLVTASGPLFSGKADSRVYVKWIEFHVPPEVKKVALDLFFGERSHGRRGKGMVA